MDSPGPAQVRANKQSRHQPPWRRRKVEHACGELPPRSPNSSVSGSASGGSGPSNKARKKANSDSPSASATNNDHGKSEVDRKLRSVLSHPLALPLLRMLHGEDPGKLDYLSRTSKFYNERDGTESTLFDGILADEVEKWRKNQERTEEQLTKALAKRIEDMHTETNFHADGEARLVKPATTELEPEEGENSKKKAYGRIHILLAPEEKGSETESTPFAIIEVGCHDDQWWLKLDQNLKYLARMGEDQDDTRLRFAMPLILAVLTIEGEGDDGSNLKLRLGVFFCSPKGTSDDDYRISLLSHSRTNDLAKASKDFGRLLRATSDLSRWRQETEPRNWEYLGPNCCKVVVDVAGQQISKVLRSYDTRFRATQRRSVIYENCPSEYEQLMIVPNPSEQVLEAADRNTSEHPLWRSKGKLLVIAAPYREGRHYAKKPAEFVPIIRELEKLHENGFVHGDIRGFNTVFTSTQDQGWLIDYDFGGKEHEATTVYPKGYKQSLDDGRRPGQEGELIEQWHDWYSLGKLFFDLHVFNHPARDTPADLKLKRLEVAELWSHLIDEENQPTQEMIADLKTLCLDLSENGWTLRPEITFLRRLRDNEESPAATYPAATGSPPEKRH